MSRRSGIHIILELPVVPTQQVLVCRLGHTPDLRPTFSSVDHTTKLSDDPCDPQRLDIALPPLDIQLVVQVALSAPELACKRAVGMVVEHILGRVVAEGLVEAANHVNRGWLKEKEFILFDSPDLGAELSVEGKKYTVVVLVGPDERIGVAPEVTTSRLVDDVVAEHVRLILKEVHHFEPHLDEFVVHSSLVGEEVMGEAGHIVAYVVLEERKLHAVLLQGQPLGVSPQRYLKGRWETRGLSQPSRKTFPAELLTIQIVMRIDDGSNPIARCFSHDVSEYLKVSVVVLMSFRLKPFPGDVQAYRVESPFFEVDEIFFYQRAFAVEYIPRRMVRELFINHVDSVIDPHSVELISQNVCIRVDVEQTITDNYDNQHSNDMLYHLSYLPIIQFSNARLRKEPLWKKDF